MICMCARHLRYACWFIFLVLFSEGYALAGTFTAFGPQSYVRSSGKPITAGNAFSILNPNTQYTLHVQNSGVSSALISLNGVQILGPSDFNPSVNMIDRLVSLQSKNEIDVELRSEPGSLLSISIIGIDNDPPIIAATVSPAPNAAEWNKSKVTVSFTCSDATSGVAICPRPQIVTAEGAGQIVSGTAIDNAGNRASTSVHINVDETPPSLIITSPLNGSTITLGTNSIGLTGTSSDVLSGLAVVACNDAPALIVASSFSCTVSLTVGPNAITVQATDVAGNSVSSILNLIYAPAPEVTITAPTDLAFTDVSPIIVSGTVNDPHATVVVNGIPAPLTSGIFSVPIPLAEGPNTVTAVATNSAGVARTATIFVTLDTAAGGPIIESTAAVAGVVGKLLQYQVIASSTDSTNLQFSLPLAPAGMTIDSRLGLVSWTPGPDQAGDQSVVVDAQDSTGHTRQAFTISVFGTRVVASGPISALTGGKIAVNDPSSTINGLTVAIRPGALPADATLTISELTAPPTLGGTTHFFMQGFAIDPDGTVLSIPATVTIPYQPSQFGTHDGIPLEDFLGIYFLRSSSGGLGFLNSYSIDSTNHVLTAFLPHFSPWVNTNIARLCPPPIQEGGEGVIVGCGGTDPTDPPSLLLPTVLVHGFQASDMCDENTCESKWGNLRSLLALIDNGRIGRIDVWRFDWASRTVPFEKSGQNLRSALMHIESLQTTPGPHLVNLLAHSFGGILVRTYLEGKATDAPYLHDVNRVITLGTPHSGIGGSFSNVVADLCSIVAQFLPKPFLTCFEAGTQRLLPFGAEGDFLRNLNSQLLPSLESKESPSYLHIKGQRLAGSATSTALLGDDGLITLEGAQLCGGSPDICAGTTVLEETLPPSLTGSPPSFGLCHSRALMFSTALEKAQGKTCDSSLNNIPMAEINNRSHPLWQEICQFLGCVPALNVIVSDGGSVSSDDGLINCGTSCSALYGAGKSVVLTANPSPGHIFRGWFGACTGTAITCVINIPADFPYIVSSGGNLYGGIFVFASFTVPITVSIEQLNCTQSGVEPTFETITASGVATGPGGLLIQLQPGLPPSDPNLILEDRTLLNLDCGTWVSDPASWTCQQPAGGPAQTTWQVSHRLKWVTVFGNNPQLVGGIVVLYFPNHMAQFLTSQSVACTMQ